MMAFFPTNAWMLPYLLASLVILFSVRSCEARVLAQVTLTQLDSSNISTTQARFSNGVYGAFCSNSAFSGTILALDVVQVRKWTSFHILFRLVFLAPRPFSIPTMKQLNSFLISPLQSCTMRSSPLNMSISIVAVVPRGNCSFMQKALVASSYGAVGLIVIDFPVIALKY